MGIKETQEIKWEWRGGNTGKERVVMEFKWPE